MPHALQDIALSIKRVQNRHHRTMDRALREVGLSLVQWDALRHAARNPQASLHDLAQLTFQSDQAFGTLASRMVERGLVERTTGHGRAIRLIVTDKGSDMLSQGATIVDQVLEGSFSQLTSQQRDQLGALMAIMLAPTPVRADDASMARAD